jgi:predicted DNA-binding ribbon-helix-helix protein
MRTSIELPDELFRQLKVLAAHRRVTLKTLMQRAVENEVIRGRAQGVRQRLRFPLLDSKEPETLNLTNGEIEDLLS